MPFFLMILPILTRSHNLKQFIESRMQNPKRIGYEICDVADEESGVSGTSKLLSAPPDSELKGQSWSALDCCLLCCKFKSQASVFCELPT